MESNYPRSPISNEPIIVCPSCGLPAGVRIKVTWWGGVVGPALMSLARCRSCGLQFNSRTGLPARKAIIAYNVVLGILAIIVLAIFTMFGRA